LFRVGKFTDTDENETVDENEKGTNNVCTLGSPQDDPEKLTHTIYASGQKREMQFLSYYLPFLNIYYILAM
jgi:hypothetical protein